MANTNPYNQSLDYQELFDRVMRGEIIAAFVDNTYHGTDVVFRDICKLRFANNQISASVRGTCYFDLSDFDVRLTKVKDLKTLFISTCEQINLGWLVP